MKTVMLASIALLASLTGCTDRGDCIASHKELLTYQQPICFSYDKNGMCTFTIYQSHNDIVDICDQWQYPDGKPKK